MLCAGIFLYVMKCHFWNRILSGSFSLRVPLQQIPIRSCALFSNWLSNIFCFFDVSILYRDVLSAYIRFTFISQTWIDSFSDVIFSLVFGFLLLCQVFLSTVVCRRESDALSTHFSTSPLA